ncbi:MAG: hypothetical protein M0011_12865 [Elusimicrobia bacterium]|nr:hypothetical protein [Elusimicrobiota bacterium]
MKNKLFRAIAILLLAAAPAAASQVSITGISWELSRLIGKKRSPYAPVSALKAASGTPFTDALRAVVSLSNSSDRPAEGLVLRYALSLRLQRAGEQPEKAFWAVPFFVEEVRVSKIDPVSQRQARVIRFELQSQLNKLKNSGFEPAALKLEVMLSPRSGDEPSEIIREAVIEISKP